MILEVKQLTKSFGKRRVLNGVSFTLEKGRSLAIVGKSGVGKTTLLHLIAHLDQPDSGEVKILGQTMTKESAPQMLRSEIAFIFQSYHLLEDFSAIENVLMPKRIARKPATRSMGYELLDKVGLKHLAETKVSFLSGGERQRVAIARALSNDPSLILADEPTGNLDTMTSEMILELLFSLGKSVVLVTHDRDLAQRCDSCIELT